MDLRSIRNSNLRFVFWNGQGIAFKRQEIEEFLIRTSVDVLLIGETWLNQSFRFNLPNYTTYRADRQGRNGGTAIVIKSTIEHTALPNYQNLETIEANSIIIPSGGEKLLVTAIYAKPGHNVINRNDLDQLFPRNNLRVLTAGDFNAHHTFWNGRRNTRRGNHLLSYCIDNSLEIQKTDQPTHYGSHRPSFIDFAICRNIVCDLEVLNDLSSDHLPVALTIRNFVTTSYERTIKRTDWEQFSVLLEGGIKLGTITNKDEIDMAVEHLTALARSAIDQSSTTTSQPGGKLTLPDSLRKLIRKRNKSRKDWMRSRTLTDRNSFNALRNLVRDRIREFKQRCWESFLEEAGDDQQTFWRITKILRRAKTYSHPIIGPNGMTFTDEDKAEVLADSLQHQCQPVYDDVDPDHIDSVEEQVATILGQEVEHFQDFTTPEEVEQLLRTVNVKKAPGPDEIPNRALRHFPRKAVLCLTAIINAALAMGYFPPAWRIATVVTIPKPGKDPMIPKNRRPISLLNNLAKVLEKIVLKRMLDHVSDNHLLPDHQHAFRPGYSTVHQLMRVTTYVAEAFDTKKSVGTVFMDVEKAFDKVWHAGLIFKLHNLRFPGYLIQTIASFLDSRAFRVRLQSAISSARPIESGVPQGSALSPMLFNLYVADIESTGQVMISQFADDTAFLYRSTCPRVISSRLQRQLDLLQDWCRKWRIPINADKTQALLLTRRPRQICPDLFYQGVRINWTNRVKYLGVTLDHRLTWETHITNKVKEGWNAAGSLIPLIGRSSVLDLRNKITVYKTIILPKMLYAAPVWGWASDRLIQRIQCKQNRILRWIARAPWYVKNSRIHEDLEMPTVKEVIKKLATSFYQKGLDHPDEAMRNLFEAADEEVQGKRRCKRPRLADFS